MSATRHGAHEILEKLGEGGMGTVYRARDTRTGDQVALKVASLAVARDPTLAARFVREARLVSTIVHPGIVRVLEAGTTEGAPWLAMELVTGETLAELLARERSEPGFRERAVAILAEVARAVHAAHEAGVVHRDLKPQNIIIDAATGRARVLDFGLARAILPESRLTQSGQTLGTPEYMAPEQAAGDLDAIDARTDVWSLGVMLHEVLVGAPPFTGAAPWKIALAVLRESIRPPRERDPQVPEALERVCLRALSRDRAARTASALAFARELEAAIPRTAPGLRPRRRAVLALSLAVLGLGGLLAGVASSSGPALPVAQAATRDRPPGGLPRHRGWRALVDEHEARGDFEGAAAALESAALVQRLEAVEILVECAELRLDRLLDARGAHEDARRALALVPSDARARLAEWKFATLEGTPPGVSGVPDAPEEVRELWDAIGGRSKHPALIVSATTMSMKLTDRSDRARLASLLGTRGKAHLALDHVAAAIADATASLALVPGQGPCLTLLGLAHERAGEFELAAAAFGRAIELEPRSGLRRLDRGRVLMKLDRLEAARVDLEAAVELGPRRDLCDPGNCRVLGFGFLRLGDRARARYYLETYTRAPKDTPDMEKVTAALAALDRDP
ncbi:MAG TPA: protein kinase [Planctomycetota bacterium]|nr:protein kinase [Planctomycetota bacterium]